MKKHIVLLLTLFLSAAAFGQSNGIYNATTYAYTTQVIQGNSTVGASSVVANPTAFAQGIPFLPYNTNAPITINRNAANAETVTPTALSNCFPNSLTCAISAGFTYKHIAGESIQSGTFGLQEAINTARAAGSGTVLVDASWPGPTGTSLITGAAGSTTVVVQDNRNPTGPVFFQWNGSSYVATGGGTGAVPSVFGRTGAVVAVTGDYTCAQVTGCPTTTPVTSLNGQTGSQTLNAGSNISITPNGSNGITIATTGSAGSGNVANNLNGTLGGYQATGTTITGAPNAFVLNPTWSVNQMSGLFTRFSGATITSWSITSNVATFQAVNGFVAGDTVALLYFPTSTFFNNNYVTVLSTGLSNTQFEVAFTHANGSATEQGYASINIPGQPQTSNGVVIVPPGLVDSPSTAFSNVSVIGPSGQVLDWRKAFAWQQASAYGVKCDVYSAYVTITSGSATINIGSTFPTIYNPVGMTMIVSQQNGFGNTGTQNVWTPTITADSSGNLTMSSTAPFSYTGLVTMGTNNQAALQRAFDDVGGSIPLWLPQCSMLTDTVRWNGASLLGQQFNSTRLIGFPGHDILQQQDGVRITAWSINASTGVTTFTIPSYAAHNILAQSDYTNAISLQGISGDSINLRGFPTATFFNNQNVYIATHPTPTTFTVNNVFGQSTSSGNDSGVAYPNTAANTNDLRIENTTFAVDNSIDPSFAWNWYNASGTLTVEPPYYRPILLWSQRQNNPFYGWGAGAVNGVATITQNSAVICAPTAGRIPVVGQTIVFPYQNGTMYTGTVSSTAGSCTTGFTARTLSTALPNTSAFTATQAEWFTYSTPQTLAVAMPATIPLPYRITLATPFPPAYGTENGVSSHGRIEIGNQQWDYMGDNFGGSAGGNTTITLRNGPTTVNGGSGYGIGSVVFPMNPCQAMYNNPWPVVPTINSGQATPLYATYYAGDCAGNAGISLPASDAIAYIPEASGLSASHFIGVYGAPTTSNSLGNQNNNGSMLIYEAGNNTGYDATFDNLTGEYLWGGFIQGPSSVNQHGVRSVGPTSTGQSIKNCTFRTNYHIALVNMQQSNIDRCDTYSTETSPYDGTSVGASMGLNIGYTISELDGGGVTNLGQFTVKDFNDEPEGGNNEELPASVQSDGVNVTWIGTIFEGGYNIFGGSYQIFNGTQLGTPVFNYGANNYFHNMYGLNTGYFFPTYVGSSFYNWGAYTQGSCSNGNSGGANTLCGSGQVQGYNGHDAWASMMGDNVHPNENILGGMILPAEFGENGFPVIQDSSELWWGVASTCNLASNASQCNYSQWDGFGGYIFIGPHQRITDGKMVLKANFKSSGGSSVTFNVQITAQNPLSYSTCTPNYSLVNVTVTAGTTWTPVQIPVDFTGYGTCAFELQYFNASSFGTVETGYFNFIPFTGQLYIPLVTHTVGAACPVAGEISLDSAHLWTCQPSSGVQFGAGTWQEH